MVKTEQVPQVLLKMISDGHIEWCKNGEDIRIADRDEFYSNVLQKYTSCSSASSFKRNMNFYGFYRVRHLLSSTIHLL
jgi:HSF-type DNA-binding